MKTLLFIIQWGLRIFIAYHLFETAYVKLSASQGAADLFTMLGMEPYGRVLMGIVELITALLILYYRTVGIGALLGAGSMGVVILFHLTTLGIVMNGDSSLFIIASSVFLASLALIIFERRTLLHYASVIIGKTEKV